MSAQGSPSTNAAPSLQPADPSSNAAPSLQSVDPSSNAANQNPIPSNVCQTQDSSTAPGPQPSSTSPGPQVSSSVPGPQASSTTFRPQASSTAPPRPQACASTQGSGWVSRGVFVLGGEMSPESEVLQELLGSSDVAMFGTI
ncbi:hypothetical protein PTTG_09090 [Puccinia triticina 1-1 BBBD Race 1]|uniref:Uncharacterized protein n=1 Tax=Puccinia triticina (isolate 1-1 / race 1 (BBBD)) TaxID=630390 RepID=A0A0C4F7F7_PUCT1|nr:hypothetical protein PTTG_09090 [Puccinia triticina 1-1 BBBD Race 1]